MLRGNRLIHLDHYIIIIIIVIMTSFAPISSKIKLSGATKPRGEKLVIVKHCVSRQWMDEEARRLRRIGSIKEIGFKMSAE